MSQIIDIKQKQVVSKIVVNENNAGGNPDRGEDNPFDANEAHM